MQNEFPLRTKRCGYRVITIDRGGEFRVREYDNKQDSAFPLTPPSPPLDSLDARLTPGCGREGAFMISYCGSMTFSTH